MLDVDTKDKSENRSESFTSSIVWFKKGFGWFGSQVGYERIFSPLSIFSLALNIIPINLLTNFAACGLVGHNIVFTLFSLLKLIMFGTWHSRRFKKHARLSSNVLHSIKKWISLS